jgi:hypothetical protein
VKLLFAAFPIFVFTLAGGQSKVILNFKFGSIVHREQYDGNGKLESRTVETILRCDTMARSSPSPSTELQRAGSRYLSHGFVGGES